jgi:hypothetical protein
VYPFVDKANAEIRKSLSGVSHYLVANKLGMSESTFGRALRFELPLEKKNMIMRAIEEHKEEQTRRKASV